ncbi:imidazole glycerol phosphate synthase, glutamine amidotransferase subunit [candidate division WOR-1 bacterium RIFOXYA2_FULL_36_21]|uniref:Imidazole glycerol phosphate synthase subunit HisH n=1 Tax=candidate division WOR-1 bacterium RIFOXYB2_FULL_36_35 TaxID=1802578 RepID=A0A1F4S8A6_UNCSA|nr:MAG: imidazole glycerol phosphate synthase, glutamine amidotransferase subunit [candidate division WOR-1 bacterium RIFOXYA2_FULL_36_21]OGC14629.1 MAG: imidazole glycerol phosphate synthase, glutamine amidotransferase subunit [candidate division WOR-1 bacterium RIFOXYA12_FULL_36_13]OGC16644.1 MAG: imidazole glycerol phosphate synthase, glutamine amidotransferase subunit [candidate division WOR-1 bacterium RIFOXYB2_FULL_36_35]
MIVIIDYGMGNLGSILNMLKKIGVEAQISSDLSVIAKASKFIFPGVGSFDNGMRKIKQLGLIEILEEKVLKEKSPILGICLGMQLFTKKSEEGELPGLGWIDAETVRFNLKDHDQNLKIPHMGWNQIVPQKKSLLFSEMFSDPKFYFVHSYHLICNDISAELTKTFYGYDFVSSVQKENIYGVQFHPEKSHKFGMKLLRNFVELC